MTDAITETVDGATERTHVAVVLARDLGTRMWANSPAGSGLTSQQATATASSYKVPMPIGEHWFIDCSLSAPVDTGIERAALVVGPEYEDFRRHIDSLELTRFAIDLAVQVNPLGTADTVLPAETTVGGELLLMVNRDNYYPRQVLRDLARHRSNALVGFDCTALVVKFNIPAERIAVSALVRARNGVLEEIVEKPSAEAVRVAGPHAPVSMNAFRFTPEIFAARCRIIPSSRGKLEIVDAVRALPGPVSVLPMTGGVLDLSRHGDIAEAEARLPGIAVSL